MTRNAFWGLCIGLCLAGTQAIAQKMESKSIKTTDKTDSISFHIDGITEGETLFTVIGGPEAPVINASAIKPPFLSMDVHGSQYACNNAICNAMVRNFSTGLAD